MADDYIMEGQLKPGIKKIILLVIFLILLVIILPWFWHYLHTGKIIITTNSPQSTITLTYINSSNVGGATSKIYKSSGQLSVSVGLGHYSATVSDSQKTTTQLIYLSSKKTLQYDINLTKLLANQPVINTQAQDIAVSINKLVYLNSSTNNINEIDSNNNLSISNPSYQFQTIKWANVNYGIGQDSLQNLYAINNGSVNELSLPFRPSKSTVYDVANNKQIYVSYGADVYMGNQSNAFKKIYAVPSSNLILGGSDNKVAIAYNSGDNGSGVMLAIVNSSGQAIKTTVGDNVSSLMWSPNSQYLASVNESSVNIYSSSLQLIAAIPTSYPTGYLSWLNNSGFVYAVNGKIWLYNLANNRTDLLSNAPLGSSVSGLAVSQDGSYVYVSTINSVTGSNSAILRVGLEGQQAQIITSQLQVILPMNLTDCTISLINFSQPPTILIEPLATQSSLSQSHYIQEAQTQLQQDGFNISQLKFKTGLTN